MLSGIEQPKTRPSGIRPRFGMQFKQPAASTSEASPPSSPGSSEILHPLRKDTVEIRFGINPSDPDHQRYLDVVRGRVREDLSRFKLPKDMEVGEKDVEVPIEHIDLPRFTRGNNEDNTGQGDGDVGDEVGEIGEDGEPQESGETGEGEEGQGKGKPGEGEPAEGEPGDEPAEGEPAEGEPGDEPAEGEQAGDEGTNDLMPDDFQIKLSRAEIARMISDELELPNFEERGGSNIQKVVHKYRTLSKLGPQGLVNLPKTLKEYLRRSLPLLKDKLDRGEFDLSDVPFDKTDFRYKDYKPVEIPKEQAVVFYVIDTSGSMQDLQKTMARNTNFFVSTYIQHRYGEINAFLRDEIADDDDFGEGVKEVFITHDASAEEVTEEEFYTRKKGGATNVSSALKLIEEQIEEKYPLDEWNVYIVHYTDGDNSSMDDPKAIESLKRMMEKGLNLYGYVETKNNYGGKKFKDTLESTFGKDHKKIRASHISRLHEDEFRKVMVDLLGKREDD